MTIIFNQSGGDTTNLSSMVKVKRVRRWNASSNAWVEIEELWYNDTGAPSASESAYKLIHRTIVVDITTNQENYNLFNQVGSPTDPVTVLCNIASGVTVGATLTSGPAFTTGGGWHVDSRVEIVNNGTILGKGGNGGNGAKYGSSVGSSIAATNGSAGGPAMSLSKSISLVNNGIIGGGGGGGGGGGFAAGYLGGVYDASVEGGGGGGGAGYGTAVGGVGGDGAYAAAGSWSCRHAGLSGVSGTELNGGLGGANQFCINGGYYILNAGGDAGGGLGAAGANGQAATFNFSSAFVSASHANGGAAGPAVSIGVYTLDLTNNGQIYGSYT